MKQAFSTSVILILFVAAIAAADLKTVSFSTDYEDFFCGAALPVSRLAQPVVRPPVKGPVTIDISIDNNAFTPDTLMINVGDTIRWTNNHAGRTHTSTSDTAVWDSGFLMTGQMFSWTFNDPGTFPYHCDIHTFMTASITVNGGATPTDTPTDTPTNTATATATSTPCLDAGSLDPSFDGDGKVLTHLGGAVDIARSVAVQADGRIVAIGNAGLDFGVVRYNTNGTLDTSFDGDGIVITTVGFIDVRASSVAIQSDGRIVVAGFSKANAGPSDDFVVVRYNTNGTLDTSFDGDGKVYTSIGSMDLAYSVAIQSDGRIVVAGATYNGSNFDFAVVRYNTDGTLDTSFDVDGKVITPIGSLDDVAYSVAIQPDGGIVAAGKTSNGTNSDFVVVRFNTNGELDTSFGGDGKAITPVGSVEDVAYSVAIQPDGRIVAAGCAGCNTGEPGDDFAVVRYNTDGTLDSSFEGDGKVITPVGSSHDAGNAVVVQPDSRIVVVGGSFINGDGSFALVRYNTNGTLDTTFDGDGKAVTVVGTSGGDFASSVAIQNDGRIVAAGYSDGDFAVVRYIGQGCPTSTPTSTPTNTPTNTATATATDTPMNTPTPTEMPSISGVITYGNAIGNPVPPRFVKNVSLSSTSGSPAVGPVITGTPGTYILSGFGTGSYTIKPTKPGGSNGAITSNDAARVAQGVVSSPAFVSQNQRFAADTSGNGNVTSNDAALIARFAAGLTGAGNAGQWKFFVTGAPSPLPTAPQTYNDSRSYASVSSNLTGEDYIGILVGEVSGNWNPATHPRPVGSRQLAVGSGREGDVAVELPQVVAVPEKEIIIPVTVQGAADKEIISYEFDLRYDPSVIQPLSEPVDVSQTVSRGLFVVANPHEPGLLRVVVYGAMPIDENGVLLNLRFTAVSGVGSISDLKFENLIFNEGDPDVMVSDGRVEISGLNSSGILAAD